jgi:hypothetical protein
LEQLDHTSTFDTNILDGTDVLHFPLTAGISTFEDYANYVFLSYFRHQLESSDRVNVVWYTYIIEAVLKRVHERREAKES